MRKSTELSADYMNATQLNLTSNKTFAIKHLLKSLKHSAQSVLITFKIKNILRLNIHHIKLRLNILIRINENYQKV